MQQHIKMSSMKRKAEPPAGPVTNKRKVATVTLRVASLDGITHNVTVPAMGLVRGVKRVVGQVRV